ncbi:hypothetical protein [Riemerella anatipestifer]|uniref:Uncharacterized protein n=1 Tax=Riemerella anatipestifer RA-CH-1 TaxID=1228997 RepID=J9QX95_RIEAN|nr:hypothetical protein [Riemerella anatipestifer]AFR34745.1 hypothetical protein B739_0137 [Riemerella anatipestifer RA-CH-1]AIH01742.1 hypothetical protein M949_0571 [Riemerella anatipestifer CH3]MCO7331548.1 hypothetical protein [Riemerella anatipestifer]MCO7350435.1 hypothetical protein [Riemerella anatipestifer]MCU7582514.1 hypothetical protein [Riemerella anatipestifer]
MQKKERLNQRNRKIRERYQSLKNKYPYWKEEYIYKKLEDEFYLSSRTLEDILYCRGDYKE